MRRSILNRGVRVSLLCSAGMLWAVAQSAQAQDAPQPADQQSGEELADPSAQSDSDVLESPSSSDVKSGEIIVTGTLLRGIAPVGTNVVSVDREAVLATGGTSTNDVLGKVPQISNSFNKSAGQTNFADFGLTVARPNIRNLGASGTNTTLVIVDGHRIVGAGVLQTTPDPDIVPPGLIERIEIVPDGGSSIYGSDAIGGVVNLITRKSFDGLEVSGRYGFADNYYQYDVNTTAGRDWGDGSLFISHVFTKHDALFGRDRDYIRQITPTNACAPGTVTIGTVGTPTAVTYALPGLAAGTRNTCDTSDNSSFVPDERRHSVFSGFNQQLNDALSVDIRAFYTFRASTTQLDQARPSVTIPRTNPFFRPIGAELQQTVAFSYGPVFGLSNPATTKLNEWGVTPSVTVELGGDWQFRALANYGRSNTRGQKRILDEAAQAVALGALTTGSALNPYDLTQTNPTVLAALRNREDFAESNQELFNARAILEGSPFALPGGAVRLALGGEVIGESYRVEQGQRTIGSGAILPSGRASRTAKSVFGELAIPIFGADNGFMGMESLTLAASGRLDDYSDFGTTFNPKVGVTWRPVRGLALRGNYGTSFNAPSLADAGAAAAAVVGGPLVALPNLLGVSTVNPAAPPASVLQSVVLVAGGNPDLQPQEAKTWSVGADFTPAFIPGLSISTTYYNVEFTNQIAIAFGPNFFAPGFENFYVVNPTQAQVEAAAKGAPVNVTIATVGPGGLTFVPVTSVAAVFATPFRPYLLANLRRNNLGSVKLDGIDFNASYVRPVGFGSINASVAGSYLLNRKVRTTATSAVVNALAGDVSRLQVAAGLGASVGDFSAQATLYHNAGYKLIAPLPGQTRVQDYNTVDLNFTYNISGEGLLRDLAFSLNVNNVFDQDPPFLNNNFGYANGSTLGRLVQLGVRKKF